MPIVHLRHPQHGIKTASLEFEAIADEKHGWVRYNPDEAPVVSNTLHLKRNKPAKAEVHDEHSRGTNQ